MVLNVVGSSPTLHPNGKQAEIPDTQRVSAFSFWQKIATSGFPRPQVSGNVYPMFTPNFNRLLMITFKATIKKEKKRSDGTWLVLIRVTMGRKSAYIPTSMSVSRKEVTA